MIKESPKNRKLTHLKKILSEMEKVLVAYSGGVDSTFLLKVAGDILGNRVLAVTAKSQTYPSWEIEEAQKMAKKLSVTHLLIETREMDNPEFLDNSPQRCYYCKKELWSRLAEIASQHDIHYIADGSNYDDASDFRPGREAAREFGIRSPLRDARLTKEDIRKLSRKFGLTTWNKPSFACLASRFPYGTTITKDDVIKVARAEKFLKDIGLRQMRVRHHGHIARIEVESEEVARLLRQQLRDKIVYRLKKLGYTYVTVDLEGYRMGSMNEVLKRVDRGERNKRVINGKRSVG